MTNTHRRQNVELRQELHGLVSDDEDLQCAISSTRAALEEIKDHPEIDSFVASVRRRTAAIISEINKP
jgi:hypothetical protein